MLWYLLYIESLAASIEGIILASVTDSWLPFLAGMLLAIPLCLISEHIRKLEDLERICL